MARSKSARGATEKRSRPRGRGWQTRIERLLPKRRWVQFTVLFAVLALVIVGIGALVQGVRTVAYSVTASPPGVGTVVLAPEVSKARQALLTELPMDAAQRAATEYLAAQPTAYWLTPEQDPPGTAGGTVITLAAAAREQRIALAVVVYGLPERDCGNHSAGGLPPDDYLAWVSEIAAALRSAPDVQKIVILEPDSLALAPECGNQADRAAQLRGAVEALGAPNTWIYLDAGHSGWLPAAQMAELIRSVGVEDRIRGFATNVSNFRATWDEFAYARQIAAELPGLHAIVDTARNGAASAGSEWCNPPGQTIGEPGGTYGDDVVDTNLWIKPPGESDGPCHGAPAAGVWWPEGAVALTRGTDLSTDH